jgi:hypothetical protein
MRKSDELRTILRCKKPEDLARNTGTIFQPTSLENGIFQFEVWYRPVTLSFPELRSCDADTFQSISPITEALLLTYFSSADGAALAGRWIAFSDLPDGRFYNQAFQGYTGNELARHFKSDPQAFLLSAPKAGGILTQEAPGDAAFTFMALPRIPLMVVTWQGDEDFPSSFQVLFDASAPHYLPTDGYAILGSTLTRRIIGKSSL